MRQKKSNSENRERIICFCYNVPESVIIQAIKDGCESLMDIRRETYASTGCAGCSEEVKKLLRRFVGRGARGGGLGEGAPEGQGAPDSAEEGASPSKKGKPSHD